jgi:hypothetical protein
MAISATPPRDPPTIAPTGGDLLLPPPFEIPVFVGETVEEGGTVIVMVSVLDEGLEGLVGLVVVVEKRSSRLTVEKCLVLGSPFQVVKAVAHSKTGVDSHQWSWTLGVSNRTPPQ